MSAALPARETMSIGEVLAELRADFPDISISKIRFLESEGLVEPQRAPSGYRRFSHDDLARLRYTLTMQKNYLPLKVIREHLDQLDRGMELVEGEADGGARPGSPRMVPDTPADPREVRMNRDSLLEAADIDDALLAELEDHGLVAARGASYDADALHVARTAGALAGYGLQPRHLRTVRSAAEREVGLVEQVRAPQLRQRDPAGRGRAEDASVDVARLISRLHAAFVDSGVRRLRN